MSLTQTMTGKVSEEKGCGHVSCLLTWLLWLPLLVVSEEDFIAIMTGDT